MVLALCVYVYPTTLAVASFISIHNLSYLQLSYLISAFNWRIFVSLRSMASFKLLNATAFGAIVVRLVLSQHLPRE